MIFLMISTLFSLFRSRSALAVENLAIRHQLGVMRRSVKCPRLVMTERIILVLLSRLWAGWRDALVVVKHETVIRWHRSGFKLFWKWQSRNRRQDRTPLEPKIRVLIRKTVSDNSLWGAPRIYGKLLKL